MADEINRTADWEPGTLDKTRKNIGLIDEKEAATMAKKLGGQVMYERTTSSSGSQGQGGKGTGRSEAQTEAVLKVAAVVPVEALNQIPHIRLHAAIFAKIFHR